jgi:hypothetical protein
MQDKSAKEVCKVSPKGHMGSPPRRGDARGVRRGEHKVSLPRRGHDAGLIEGRITFGHPHQCDTPFHIFMLFYKYTIYILLC